MAAKILGQLGAVVIPATSTLTKVYKCPVNRRADVNIHIANSADTDTQIKLALIRNDVVANVAAEDYLLGGTVGLATSTLANNLAPLEFSGFMLEAGDEIGVFSSASALAAQVNGIEEDA